MKHKTTLLISTIFFGFLGSVNDFTIQSSKLRDIEENAFDGTHQRLHTLSIHNSLDLKIVPRAVSKVWILCLKFSLNPLRISLARETDTKMIKVKSCAIPKTSTLE